MSLFVFLHVFVHILPHVVFIWSFLCCFTSLCVFCLLFVSQHLSLWTMFRVSAAVFSVFHLLVSISASLQSGFSLYCVFLLFFFRWKRVYVFMAVIQVSKGSSASLWSLMTDFCSRSESRSPLPAPLFFNVSLLHWSLFDLWPLYENRWRRLTKQRAGTETGLQA